MLFALIALWGIAALLFISNPKDISTRWAALTAFSGGGGGLSRTITETILPYIQKYQLSNPDIKSVLEAMQNFGSFINQNGMPYCFLMYALTRTNFLGTKIPRIISPFLAVPMLVMLFFTKWGVVVEHNFKLLFIFCVPYLIFGLLILTYHFLQERNVIHLKEKWFFFSTLTPLILFQAITNYTFRAFFNNDTAWRLMPFMILILLIGFISFATKYGALGVRLRIEQNTFDRTLKSLTSGTAILNHTLKNEIMKISICTDIIKENTSSLDVFHANKQGFDGIYSSIYHLQAMVNRIHEHTQDIVLQEKNNNLFEIVNKCVTQIQPILNQKNINLSINIPINLFILCDEFHQQEILSNLINNSIEALDNYGTILIETSLNKKTFTLSIQDNGKGIAKENLQRVLDPFFSTKKSGLNFGLGLSYCYSVMHTLGGNLNVNSQPHSGTTISLVYPIKKYQLNGGIPTK